MILLLHIAIAMTSIAVATFLIGSPSRLKLRASYSLIAATLLSGTALVMLEPAQMLRGCTAGLVYIAVITAITARGRARLLALEIKNQ